MINTKFFALLGLLLVTFNNSLAQVESPREMTLHLELLNPSSEINNAVAFVSIDGGLAPYQYKWSNVNTALDSPESVGLIEGMQHSVTVTDAKGKRASRTFTIPAESITEIFNSNVQPAVDVLGAVLFWDAFASLGIYDPVVYTSHQNVLLPTRAISDDEEYHVKKWLVGEGSQVKEGEEIAVLQNNHDQELSMHAPADGTLEQVVKEGAAISRTPKRGSGTVSLVAVINFKTPQPLSYPNGDVKTNTIPFIVIWLILGSIFFTLRLKFVNIRGFRHSLDLARGKYDDPDAPGTITHFQAMATAVSATVGLGNIA
ncbi:MAG: biotin/lipoyl-containing protein, partial [Gelidibacter sp.]